MNMTSATAKSTRTTVLTEARKLFARHGYEGVSMRDIAGAVGVRQSAIYNHFASKQDLLVQLMFTHMERVLCGLREALTDVCGPAQRLETFARYHVSYHIDQSDDVFLAYMELRSLEEPGRGSVMKLRDAYEAELRTILAAGVDDGSFGIGSSDVVARALLAMLTGVTVWFREGRGLSRDEVTETYVQAAVQAVGLVYSQRT